MNPLSRALLAPSAALILVALGLPASAGAQYFGRNKVQYERFDFEVLKTEHFDVYYYPAEREAVALAARMAERWYARLSKLLSHELRGRQPLILYASQPHFQQTNAVSGEIGEGTGGVTESFKRRIVLPFGTSLAETDHVLGHELVHAFQYDILGPGAAGRLPLWFIEGMAEYFSVGPVDPQTAAWIRDALRHDDLPTVAKLDNPRYFPYRYGQAFWAYVGGRWGDEAIGRALKEGKTRDAWAALTRALHTTPDTLSGEWHAAIREAFAPVDRETRAPADYGTPVITRSRGGGRINVAPVLSPDGTKVAFFSERDLFSIELFVADVATGEVLRRVTKTARDPHFESLQFISSAGAWHPDGRRFVFGGIVKGQPVLSILDTENGRIEREIRLDELDEVLHPAWSPDGRRIAFTALVGGFSDLFVYDLAASRLRRLTEDAYADLQPAWSPDGRAIAFVTDRFSTDLETLDPGNYRLALIDPETGHSRALAGFPGAKHVNPQWSRDGGDVYFVSDREGIANVYRLALASGELFQVTDLYTAVTGITALSPAISAALKANRLVLTAYDEGRYDIYLLEGAARLAGTAPQRVRGNPAALPPPERRDSALVRMLRDARTGLPPSDTSFSRQDYRPSFSLDYIAQPYLAVAADRFGAYVGGGASLFWSSMLGDHMLATLLQVNGSFKDVAAQVGYSNLASRLNWGLVAGQIPYVTGFYSRTAQTVSGQPAIVDSVYRFRQYNREVAGIVAYPFNRVRRIELQAGFRNISFDTEVQIRAISRNTGEVLVDDERDLPNADPLNMGLASLALVHDNSYFGGTGPVLGQRYRLEVSPTVGSLSYVTTLADFRRYEMPVRPFTLAARVLHFGRYGRSSEDPRLVPLFLGYQSLVRGYNDGSFTADECDTNACPVFDQLLGSRLLVANAELRIPLLGPLGVAGRGAVPPVEAALFADAGVAWTSASEAWFLGGDRDAVTSAGVALRINLFGFAIVEMDYVRPFERPRKGWYFQFGFTPAF